MRGDDVFPYSAIAEIISQIKLSTLMQFSQKKQIMEIVSASV
jgi:hypothetical protein